MIAFGVREREFSPLPLGEVGAKRRVREVPPAQPIVFESPPSPAPLRGTTSPRGRGENSYLPPPNAITLSCSLRRPCAVSARIIVRQRGAAGTERAGKTANKTSRAVRKRPSCRWTHWPVGPRLAHDRRDPFHGDKTPYTQSVGIAASRHAATGTAREGKTTNKTSCTPG